MNKQFINILLVAVVGVVTVSADTCVKHGPCTCQLNNGSWIDLRVLANPVVPRFQYLKFSTAPSLYSWSPCVDIMYGVPSNGDDCTPGVAVCENFLGTSDTYFHWGDQNSVEYLVDGNGGVSLLYSHYGRTTTVILECREHTQDQVLVDDATSGTLTLRLISRCSCADTCAITHGQAGIPNGPTYTGAFFKDSNNNTENSDSEGETSKERKSSSKSKKNQDKDSSEERKSFSKSEENLDKDSSEERKSFSKSEKNQDKDSSEERKGSSKSEKNGRSTSKPQPEDDESSNSMNTNFAALKAVDPGAENADAMNSGGISTGGIIGVTLLSLVAVYLVGGMALKRSFSSARGMEMIPNYSFWTGIADSIRKKTSYVFNGCRSGYTYDSY